VERVGVFGGTFDPVHVGHLVAASVARSQLELDRVLLVVAGDPWQKQGKVVAPAEARYEMVVAAVGGVEGLEPSAIELERDGPTYTVDTLERLRAPQRALFLILGSDAASRIGTWHRVDELRALATLAVVEREGCTTATVPQGWNVVTVTMPRLDVSSTDLRRRIAAGEPVDFLVPEPALRVVREHDLYTGR
jgi:nicotinate-nucleotide adenylyltransferase